MARQHWTSAGSVVALKPMVTGNPPDWASPHPATALGLAWIPNKDGRWGREEDGKGRPRQQGCSCPAHLLSPRESVVEAGHVSHDGFLIWPQSAYNICAERERGREREARESERCREGGRGRALGSCGRNSACSGLEAKPRFQLCRPILLRF